MVAAFELALVPAEELEGAFEGATNDGLARTFPFKVDDGGTNGRRTALEAPPLGCCITLPFSSTIGGSSGGWCMG